MSLEDLPRVAVAPEGPIGVLAPISAAPPAREKPPLTQGLLIILSVSAGVSVANLYYNQPLLADMARDLHLTTSQVGLVPTLSQVGYGLGMLLIVPLGDMIQRRSLILVLLALVTAALVAEATAGNLFWLAGASLAIGITTVVPQVILPLAAQLADPGRRGKVVGWVMGGLLTGILLSRTLGGMIAHYASWRAVYGISAGMMVVLAAALRLLLPEHELIEDMTYGRLLRSVSDLLRTQPALREAATSGALLFAAFSAFWATLVFRLGAPPLHYGTQAAGLFGVIGAAGALAAPLVGRLADQVGPRAIVGRATALVLLSFVIFWAVGHTLWGLIVGVLVLDLAVQAAQVANMTRIYNLVPTAQSRLNTAFMTCYFGGGSIGSLLGTNSWSIGGWNGVCAVGGGLVSIGLLHHLLAMRRPAHHRMPVERLHPTNGSA